MTEKKLRLPTIALYIDYLPPRRWLRRLVDRLLAPWFVSIAEHKKLLDAYERADLFRSNWQTALYHTQTKGLSPEERRDFFRDRDIVRVNDTLYSGWLLREVLGPATVATKDDRLFSEGFRRQPPVATPKPGFATWQTQS